MLALGTANDWTGRTSDFAGMGTVLLVLALGVATFVALRSRARAGGAAGGAAVAALCTLLTVEVLRLQPSPWWVVALSTYAALAAWDLRRTMRRGR